MDRIVKNLPAVVERHRKEAPAISPQALAWDKKRRILWLGSRDLKRIYAVEPESWKVVAEDAAPGIPWASVVHDNFIQFNLGEGEEDDRFLRSYRPGEGWGDERIACPDFTGSYLSYDGNDVYLSQWYRHRILRLEENGEVAQAIEVGAEICGHTFVAGSIYLLRGTEQNGEHWTIARLNPAETAPAVQDLAVVPFACRSLAHDGKVFWTNHRAANETVSFVLP